MQSSSLVLPLTLGFIMFGIGTRLRASDFQRVFREPNAILTGLVAQILLLPALAFGLAWLLPIDPIFQVGLVLIAACPGGSSSNLVTHLLKARTALSVSMTALNSFAILLSLPLIVEFALAFFLRNEQAISLPIWSTVRNVLYTVAIPVVAGVWLNHQFPKLTNRLQRPLHYLMPLLLLGAFAWVLFFADKSQGTPNQLWGYAYLFWPALGLNLLAMASGYLAGFVTGLSDRSKVTLAIEVGLQNSALAIFVANNLIGNYELSVMALVYSGFTFFSTLGIAWGLKKWRWRPDNDAD